MSLYIQETYINKTEGYIYSEDEPYESWVDTPGQAFKWAQKDHGRCEGKVYRDGPDGEAQHIGWIFVKTRQYSDTHEPYLCETWVTLHKVPPRKHTEYDVLVMN